MSPVSFATSPAARGDQRKFFNPTPGWVGVNVFGPDGKPTAIAVEPGGDIWLTPEEERMTAEAPRLAQDNPFVKEWEAVVETDPYGEPITTELRQGVLVLADAAPRPTASSRFIPARAEEIVGTETEEQPAVQGQAAEGEIVGTPEAVAANDNALAKRASTPEQPTRRRPADDAPPRKD